MGAAGGVWGFGPLFNSNVTWGAFEVGVGTGGVYAGPNWGRALSQGWGALTGQGFSMGVPTFNVATPAFSMSGQLWSQPAQYAYAGNYAAAPTTGPQEPNAFVPDPNAMPIASASSGMPMIGGPAPNTKVFQAELIDDVEAYMIQQENISRGLQQLAHDPYKVKQPYLLMPVTPNPAYNAHIETGMAYANTGLGYARTVGEIGGSILFEPFDWAMTAVQIYNEPTNAMSYVGLVPFVPASIGKYGDDAFAAGRRWFGSLTRAADNATVNLIDSSRARHILYGDPTGGGHKWGLTRLFNGKTKFPFSWSDDKILHAISDVATQPNAVWVQQTGKLGAKFTKSGVPVKFRVDGVYEGVKIRAIMQNNKVVTGFPIE